MTGDPRQGDYLPGVDRLLALDSDGQPVERSTPLGVVLLSQCCDMARGGTGDPVAAAVVKLEGSAASMARSGRQPRYAALPWLGDDVFSDLSISGAVGHSLALLGERTSAPTTDDRAYFAGRISRWFGRFAYPDEVQPFLRRIQERIRSKASSETSPLGQCLQRVVTIRVENETGWDVPPPWDLVVVFVVNEGELPTPGADVSAGIPTASAAQIAERIAEATAGSAGLDALWHAMAGQLIHECRSDNDSAIVGQVIAEVVEESEFSYYRYRRSADLDVDDLSD